MIEKEEYLLNNIPNIPILKALMRRTIERKLEDLKKIKRKATMSEYTDLLNIIRNNSNLFIEYIEKQIEDLEQASALSQKNHV